MKCGLWTSFLPGLSRESSDKLSAESRLRHPPLLGDGGASIQMPRSVLEHALLPKQVDLSNV